MMLKQMKKTLGILLAVCFLLSVTAAAASAHGHSGPAVVKEKKIVSHCCGPVVVKEKKTVILIVQDVKTKIYKHHHKHHHGHHHKMHHHGHHHHHKLMKAVKAFMD
jgi:hypothetical protein